MHVVTSHTQMQDPLIDQNCAHRDDGRGVQQRHFEVVHGGITVHGTGPKAASWPLQTSQDSVLLPQNMPKQSIEMKD